MRKKYTFTNINFVSYNTQEQMVRKNYKLYNEIVFPSIRIARIIKQTLGSKHNLNKFDRKLYTEVSNLLLNIPLYKGTYVV